MSFTAQRYTRAVRKHDPELYVIQPQIGGMCFLMRKGQKLRPYSFDGGTLWVSEPNPMQIMALTDDWTAKGAQVEWGILPLMEKIRSMDSHNDTHDGGIIARLERNQERMAEAKRREQRSLHEAMAYEAHGAFRKAFKDINTSTLSKSVVTKGMKKNGYLQP